MFSAFSTALSALSADSTAIEVTGYNLSNLNTVGYKGSAVSFKELVAASLGGGKDDQVRIGVDKPTVTRGFTQGNIQASSGLFDVAIRGAGFLTVKDTDGQTFYTRAGNLQVDKAGNLLTAGGDKVQGWSIDPTSGQQTNDLSGLVIPVNALTEPVATTNMSMTMNLQADAAVTNPATDPPSLTNNMQVYDNLGGSHNLRIQFWKDSAGVWDYRVTIPKEELADPSVGDLTLLASDPTDPTTQLTFGPDGKLDPATTTSPIQIPVTTGMTGGAAPASVPIAFASGAALGDANGHINWALFDDNKKSLSTEFAQPSALSANSRDGQAPGAVLVFSIADGGKVVAKVSNGPERVVGMLAVAAIQNPETLTAVGDNKYQLSDSTATPAVGVAGTGGRGDIVASSLEGSNVDIAREFTNLIVFQRGYQANAKMITTVDELSQETINLKR